MIILFFFRSFFKSNKPNFHLLYLGEQNNASIVVSTSCVTIICWKLARRSCVVSIEVFSRGTIKERCQFGSFQVCIPTIQKVKFRLPSSVTAIHGRNCLVRASTLSTTQASQFNIALLRVHSGINVFKNFLILLYKDTCSGRSSKLQHNSSNI